jgi:hypothetical protein
MSMVCGYCAVNLHGHCNRQLRTEPQEACACWLRNHHRLDAVIAQGEETEAVLYDRETAILNAMWAQLDRTGWI